MADSDVAQACKELALEGYAGPSEETLKLNTGLARLRRLGTELWMDTGDIEAAKPLWCGDFTACTTNNTLANKVIQTGRMDEEIKHVVAELKSRFPDLDKQKLLWEIGFVVNCRLGLSLVSELDCKVSVELHPDFAHDVDLSLDYAKRYYDVCPEYFYIKVPLTPAGLVATRRLSDAGVPVNFTIAFSARQNYLMALLSRPKFCNVFLGRNNVLVKDNGLGTGEYVGEAATLAAQRAVREVRESGPTCPTRLIAASIRSAQQIYDLAGVDVMTIPPKAVREFYDSEPTPESIESRLERRYDVGVAEGKERLSILWEVSDKFKEYADRLAGANPSELTPEALVERGKEAGLSFLQRFSEEEIARITQKGKIPGLADWGSEVALDDLMTESALQSFATDQRALDDRISSFL